MAADNKCFQPLQKPIYIETKENWRENFPLFDTIGNAGIGYLEGARQTSSPADTHRLLLLRADQEPYVCNLDIALQQNLEQFVMLKFVESLRGINKTTIYITIPVQVIINPHSAA